MLWERSVAEGQQGPHAMLPRDARRLTQRVQPRRCSTQTPFRRAKKQQTPPGQNHLTALRVTLHVCQLGSTWTGQLRLKRLRRALHSASSHLPWWSALPGEAAPPRPPAPAAGPGAWPGPGLSPGAGGLLVTSPGFPGPAGWVVRGGRLRPARAWPAPAASRWLPGAGGGGGWRGRSIRAGASCSAPVAFRFFPLLSPLLRAHQHPWHTRATLCTAPRCSAGLGPGFLM